MPHRLFYKIICVLGLLIISTNCYAISSCDTNRDGRISPMDVLRIINALNSSNFESDEELDVNLDGNVTPLDILIVINYLNSNSEGTCGKEIVKRIILSPEELSPFQDDTPSTPLPSPSESPSLVLSPSPSEKPSESPSNTPVVNPSPSPKPECPNPREKKDIDGVCCEISNIDSCNRCYGSGPNICNGSCEMGPFPLDQMVNECGECGNKGRNECGSCLNSTSQVVKGCDNICGSGKTFSGCDSQCGSTKLIDKCGVCGGDGSSCKCIFVATWSIWSGYWADTEYYSSSHTSEEIYKSGRFDIVPRQPLPSCLVNAAKKDCMCGDGTANNPAVCTRVPQINQNDSTKIWGGCRFSTVDKPARANYDRNCHGMLGNMASRFQSCKDPNFPGGYLSAWLKEELDSFQQILKLPPGEAFRNIIPPNPGATDDAYYWYLDENCNAVIPSPGTKPCGFAGLSWSPISLILNDEADLELDNQIVEFSLSASKDSKYAIWKGSDKTPLLVYDPDNTGKVESVRQLFGNFAFGGKTNQPLDYRNTNFREPWANGYQALALLDKNKNEKLDGNELDVLKLWFDFNRDAKVDQGELRLLKDSSISALYYKDVEYDDLNKNYKINKGFESIGRNTIQTGMTVDWFGESFVSKSEAISAISAKFSNKKQSNIEVNSTRDDQNKHNSVLKDVDMNPKTAITGYWIWTLKENGGANNPGYFVFGQDNSGNINGYTISEAIMAKNDQHVRSAMISVWGTGKVEILNDGTRKYNITFKDKSSGGIANTSAKLSSDGELLEGVTEQSFELNENGKKRSAKMKYEWAATRVDSIAE